MCYLVSFEEYDQDNDLVWSRNIAKTDDLKSALSAAYHHVNEYCSIVHKLFFKGEITKERLSQGEAWIYTGEQGKLRMLVFIRWI